MKRVILIAVTAMSIMASCTNEPRATVKDATDRVDTTTAVYVIAYNKSTGHPVIQTSRVVRQIKDSARIVDDKVIKKRDTFYFIPMIDTARGQDKLPIKDSSGNVKFQEQYYSLDKKFIITDYNKKF